MIYPIVAYGDSVLREPASDIESGGETDVKKLSADMFETMHAAQGVGLAGPQIGLGLRIFVVDGAGMEEEELADFQQVFINAQVLEETGDKWEFEEGCLSLPGIREKVARPETVRIRYFDENWEAHEEEFDGLKARIIQHEYDHIEGVLFTDYLTTFKKRILKGKLRNISKGIVKSDYRMRFPSIR